jgi:hypothetical protein
MTTPAPGVPGSEDSVVIAHVAEVTPVTLVVLEALIHQLSLRSRQSAWDMLLRMRDFLSY